MSKGVYEFINGIAGLPRHTKEPNPRIKPEGEPRRGQPIAFSHLYTPSTFSTSIGYTTKCES